MNTVEKSHLWASTGYYFFKFLRVDAVVKEVGWKGIGRGGVAGEVWQQRNTIFLKY